MPISYRRSYQLCYCGLSSFKKGATRILSHTRGGSYTPYHSKHVYPQSHPLFVAMSQSQTTCSIVNPKSDDGKKLRN